jgi:hypothetical protein
MTVDTVGAGDPVDSMLFLQGQINAGSAVPLSQRERRLNDYAKA